MLAASLAQRKEGSTDEGKLFAEEARLSTRGGSRSGLAARDADNAEHSHFRERGAGNENAVGGGIEIRRSYLDTVVEQRKKVVRDHAFDGIPIHITKANPQAVQLRPAEEGFALRLEGLGELANEVNGANAS